VARGVSKRAGQRTVGKTNPLSGIDIFNKNVMLETEIAITKRSFLAGVTASLAVVGVRGPVLARAFGSKGIPTRR
jgi:hypothetical protein